MSESSNRFFHHACLFETGLIPLAYLLGYFADIDPSSYLYPSREAISWGLIGTVPLYIFFVQAFRSQSSEMQRIRTILLEVLGRPLAQCNWIQLLLLATLAGISEEYLFRGVIQPWLENCWSPIAGLIVTSLLFGLLHFITPLYALLTIIGSLYLGIMLDVGETRNLLTPMIIHGLYDFAAFIAIVNAIKTNVRDKS